MANVINVSRRALLAAAGGGTLGLLASCSSSDGASGGGGGGGEGEVWVLSDDVENPIQQAALDRFNADSKVKLKLVEVPATQSMNDKVRTAINTKNRPDIYFNWAGGSIRPYARNNLLVDFTPKFDADTAWRDSFVQSVLDAGKIDDKYFGIPMKGMQPVLLFYNKSLFADKGLKPPTTWDELKSVISALKKSNVTPIALGGQDSWTELMYLEFLVDRIGGPDVFQRIQGGDSSGWDDPAVSKSLDMITELVDMGAFGTNYSSVGYGNGAANALFAKGRAAMQLMGAWLFTGVQGTDPKFVKNDLAYTNFPAIEGGKGDPKNTVGNPTNYFSVVQTDVSDACVDFLKTQMTNSEYVSDLIKAGDVPAVAGIEDQLDQHTDPEFAKAVYHIASTAPHFTLSWDQALDIGVGQTVVTNLQKVFNKQIDTKAFIAAVKASK